MGPLLGRPPWVLRGSLPNTYLLSTIMRYGHRAIYKGQYVAMCPKLRVAARGHTYQARRSSVWLCTGREKAEEKMRHIETMLNSVR